jgi:hypothetical protein
VLVFSEGGVRKNCSGCEIPPDRPISPDANNFFDKQCSMTSALAIIRRAVLGRVGLIPSSSALSIVELRFVTDRRASIPPQNLFKKCRTGLFGRSKSLLTGFPTFLTHHLMRFRETGKSGE